MPTSIALASPHLATAPASTRHCLIYFLTGNPGIIDYYAPFLNHLRVRLDAIEAKRQHEITFHIYGRDLAGFSHADPAAGDSHDPGKDHDYAHDATTGNHHPPYNVEAQVQYSLKHLLAANTIPAPSPRAGGPFDEVILIGHSLGTYLALELFHRHLHDLALASASASASSPNPTAALHLRAGVLLFATIAHLAKSPKGRQLDLLRRTPVLGPHAHALARLGLRLLPEPLLRWVLRRLLAMPPHAEDATARFLTAPSPGGVHQALHLGMDEMAVIADEGWAEELWEVAEEAEDAAEGDGAREPLPKFFILFGKKDHWVANEYRDRFIREREAHAAREGVPGHKRGRTRIVVEEEGVPHDFCISESPRAFSLLLYSWPSMEPEEDASSFARETIAVLTCGP